MVKPTLTNAVSDQVEKKTEKKSEELARKRQRVVFKKTVSSDQSKQRSKG